MATTTPGSALVAQRKRLPNGLTILYNRAASNPSLVLRALIRAGASREPLGDQGLAAFTGRMLRQGTRSLSKQALAEELDAMGAGLSIDVGYSVTAGSIKCLAEDARRVTEILSEVLRYPTVPPTELERVRGQVLTDLKEQDDNTRAVAERLWRRLAYPESHRYHRLVSAVRETAQRFTAADVTRFHERWYTPSQTTLVVVGSAEAETVFELIERTFGDWGDQTVEPVAGTLPPTPAPQLAEATEVMEGKTQADVVLGLPTLERTNPDYYALAFANHVLGRMYFMGRFGEKVRDEQGLAYYAYSDLAASYGSGPWAVRAGVNPRNLARALESIRAEIARFLADGETEQEHEDGVRSILGSLPRALETNDGAAAVLGEIDLYDLGLDYLDRYPEIIRSLSREQVVEASRRWLRPESMVTAIAGPAA